MVGQRPQDLEQEQRDEQERRAQRLRWLEVACAQASADAAALYLLCAERARSGATAAQLREAGLAASHSAGALAGCAYWVLEDEAAEELERQAVAVERPRPVPWSR